jgi:hypothetical protein
MTSSVVNADKLCIEARTDDQAPVSLRTIVVCQLKAHRLFGMANLVPPLPRINKLSEPKSNQDTENDDTYFAGESAPAMQRLGQFELHATGAPQQQQQA